VAKGVKIEIFGDSRDAVKALDKVGDAGERMGGTLGKARDVALGVFGGQALYAGAEKFAGFLGDGIDAASDLNETLSKTDAIFGEASKGMQEFAAGAPKALGLTKTQALDAAGAFAILLKQTGKAPADVAGMSKSFTGLSADLASFYNTAGGAEEASQKLGAALRGEYEGVRTLGVVMSDASIKAEALRVGIGKQGQELTEGEKIQARYSQILRETTIAQGKFAEESGSAAGQSKILKAQITELQTELGSKLLPAKQAVLKAFVEFLPVAERVAERMAKDLAPAARDLGKFIKDDVYPALKDFAGILKDDVYPVLKEDVWPVIVEGAKKLGAILKDPVGPALKDFAGFLKDDVWPVLKDVARFIDEKVLPVLKDFADFLGKDVFPALAEFAGKIGDAIGKVKDTVLRIWGAIGDDVKKITEGWVGVIKGVIEGWTKILSGAFDHRRLGEGRRRAEEDRRRLVDRRQGGHREPAEVPRGRDRARWQGHREAVRGRS
jgi:hypothetical protein